jgi:hypothetical protein
MLLTVGVLRTLYPVQRLRHLWTEFITTCLKTWNLSTVVLVWWLIYGVWKCSVMLTSALNVSERSASWTVHCFLYIWFVLAGGQYVPRVGNNACHCLSDCTGTDWQNGRQTDRQGNNLVWWRRLTCWERIKIYQAVCGPVSEVIMWVLAQTNIKSLIIWQRCCWRFKCSVMWHCVVVVTVTGIHVALCCCGYTDRITSQSAALLKRQCWHL